MELGGVLTSFLSFVNIEPHFYVYTLNIIQINTFIM